MVEHDSDDEDQYESQEQEDSDGEDGDEVYDYDQLDFTDGESEQPTANMHPSLVQDIANVQKKYGEKAIDYRKLDYIEDIEIELHLPGNHFDYEVAKAWEIRQDEDIIVRLHMNVKNYLDADKEPKTDIFQPSKKENFSIGIQMESIVKVFLAKVWNTFSNSPVALAVDNNPGTSSNQRCTNEEKNHELEASVSSSHDVKRLPSRDAGFLAMVYDYCHQRLDTLNEFCVVCDEPHVSNNGAAMLKPTVCVRDLCVFAFQSLGVMSAAEPGIATEPEVVHLLIRMALAACKSKRSNLIFDPFPTIVDPMNPKCLALTPSSKDFRRCERALEALNMNEMSCYIGPEVKKTIDAKDKLAYPLLQWLISSNRSYIVKLPESAQLSFMGTPHQFLLMSSPSTKDAKFNEHKAKHGSTFAFHGSSIENWHSIIRHGLINASGTKFQMHGALSGKGIYLSPDAMVSYEFSNKHALAFRQKRCRSSSEFPDVSGDLICLALCEVVTSPCLRKEGSHSTRWVMPDEDKVRTRFFFVYDKNVTPQKNVNTQLQTYSSKIKKAVAYHK